MISLDWAKENAISPHETDKSNGLKICRIMVSYKQNQFLYPVSGEPNIDQLSKNLILNYYIKKMCKF